MHVRGVASLTRHSSSQRVRFATSRAKKARRDCCAPGVKPHPQNFSIYERPPVTVAARETNALALIRWCPAFHSRARASGLRRLGPSNRVQPSHNRIVRHAIEKPFLLPLFATRPIGPISPSKLFKARARRHGAAIIGEHEAVDLKRGQTGQLVRLASRTPKSPPTHILRLWQTRFGRSFGPGKSRRGFGCRPELKGVHHPNRCR